MELIREHDRTGRKHNIAVMLLEVAKNRRSNNDFVSASNLRESIREKLGLPVLFGKDHYGDLRAHGDAYGGHGLCLDTHKSRNLKAILLNDNNIKLCKEYLSIKRNSLGCQIITRKTGQKTSSDELMNWPHKKLTTEILKQVRGDHGGKNAIENILKKIPGLTAKQAEQVNNLIAEKITGRRKSIRDKLTEIDRRLALSEVSC